MPESFIIYRLYFENLGYTEKWWKDYSALTSNERKIANSIIESNNFDNIDKYNNNKNIYKVLKYYTIRRDFVESKVS